jgi:hypothetical protein
MLTEFQSEIMKGRANLEDAGVDGRTTVNFRAVVLTDIFPVAALAASVGFRWPLCINHTKKAVKFKYTFKLCQYFLI